MQDFLQDLASLARKILARFGYFLQDGFYWVYIYIIIVHNYYVGRDRNFCTTSYVHHFIHRLQVNLTQPQGLVGSFNFSLHL